MVYGREIDGEVTTFGTTGYTYRSVFVLYDRASESIWYPLQDGAFDAISGTRRGEQIAIIDKPRVMTLGEWRNRHPQTTVLLADRLPEGDLEQPRSPPGNSDLGAEIESTP